MHQANLTKNVKNPLASDQTSSCIVTTRVGKGLNPYSCDNHVIKEGWPFYVIVKIIGRRMATAASTKRLRQDYLRLQRDPVPYVEATPLPSNMLEWYEHSLYPLTFHWCVSRRDVDLRNPISRHYVVKGPEDTPYYGELGVSICKGCMV